MMTLQDWLEGYDIDSKACLCVALTTTGFSVSKGKLSGIHLAPMWNRDLHTLLPNGASQERIDKNFDYTKLSWDEYQLRGRSPKAVRAKIEELLEYCHYLVVYNKRKFFNQWIGAHENESLECLEDLPLLDICNVAKCREEGEDFSGLSFDTVFDLDDYLDQRFDSLKKTSRGSCSFHNLVARYVPDSVCVDAGGTVLQGDACAENLRTLTEILLQK